MEDVNILLKEVERLDEQLRPVAARPVVNPSAELASPPGDLPSALTNEAGHVLRRLLPRYEHGATAERESLRAALSRYPSFAWAAVPPGPIHSIEDLRTHLLAFSLLDQAGDPRDEFRRLVAICRHAQAANLPVRRTLFKVAALSGAKNRGKGSTRSLMWWAALWPFRYGGPEHDKYLRA